MNITELAEFIKSLEPECEVKEGKQFAEAAVPSTKLHSLAKSLRENDTTAFDFLVCLSAVDWGQDLGVVYHLRSTKYSHMVVLKVRTAERQNPAFDSVTDIWMTADFHEREAFDLMGIRFKNHPDMRRLFLDSSWGFPLRKDYVDDVNIVTR